MSNFVNSINGLPILADRASKSGNGTDIDTALAGKFDKNGYVGYKEGFWVGVKWPITTNYESSFWKVCSFSVSNYWSISFKLTATNLFFDSVGQETKVVTVSSLETNFVRKAVECRTKYIKIDERGYGNIMYYTIDNGVVTIYVKTAKKANETQFLRLVSVTNLSSITNLTWYCEEAPGEQPSSPTKFTEQIVNVTPSVGSQTLPVYSDAYGKLQQCDPSQMSVGSATTATNYASGGGIANAINAKQDTISDLATIRSGATAGASALQPSGNGSNLSVTPDGTSTGTDIGSSTTLKAWAQKFKNLVASLKALAFKDKASYNDLSSGVQSSLDKADSALQSHQSVTDNNPTLSWGTTSKVGTVGSTDLRVTMPANPATGKQDALPTTGTASDTYAINISGNATTAGSVAWANVTDKADASTSAKGIVQLQDSIGSTETSTDKAATPHAVRAAIDSAVSSAYHAAGTKTVAQLTSALLVAANAGDVYNMTDSGETTTDFVEGAGKPIRIGDNVGICDVGGGVYKFDLLSGFVDLSNYLTKTGDGKDVTSTLTKASGDTSGMTSGSKLSALFTAISSFFGTLKALAFKDKAAYSDLSSGVQSSLDKADSALQSHQSVTDNNPTLSWGTTSKVGTVGSTDLRVTMPANPANNKQSNYLAVYGSTDKFVKLFRVYKFTAGSSIGTTVELIGRAGGSAVRVVINIKGSITADYIQFYDYAGDTSHYFTLYVAQDPDNSSRNLVYAFIAQYGSLYVNEADTSAGDTDLDFSVFGAAMSGRISGDTAITLRNMQDASWINSGTFDAARIPTSLPNTSIGGSAGAVTSIGEGQSNAARHVWFSDAGDETKRVHNSNFTYNPVGNIISANISGNANGSAAYTNFIYDGESAGQRGSGQRVRMYGIDNTNNAYQSWYKVATIAQKSQTNYTSARLVGTLFASGSNWAANINNAIHFQILFNFVSLTYRVYHTPNPNVKSLIRLVAIDNNDTYEVQICPQGLNNYSNFRLYIWDDQNNNVTVSFASGAMGEAASNGTVIDDYQIDPYYGRLANSQVGAEDNPIYINSDGLPRPCHQMMRIIGHEASSSDITITFPTVPSNIKRNDAYLVYNIQQSLMGSINVTYPAPGGNTTVQLPNGRAAILLVVDERAKTMCAVAY